MASKQSSVLIHQAELSSDPPSPAAGYTVAYPKTDGRWYIKNSAGVVTKLSPEKIKIPQQFTDGATVTIAGISTYENWFGTIAGNRTFVFKGAEAGDYFKIRIIQDTTGGRTITWPTSVKWKGGVAPTLTATGGAVDVIIFYYTGTVYEGVYANDFK